MPRRKPRKARPNDPRTNTFAAISAAPVTLPPFPWATEASGGDGRRYALATRALAADQIDGPGVLDDERHVQATREAVWRTRLAPWLRRLHPTLRAALAAYADAAERVGASGGPMDPTGGGGSRQCSTSAGPSHARLAATERLCGMRAAIGDGVTWLNTGETDRLVPGRHFDLARMAGVEALTRLGVGPHGASPIKRDEATGMRATVGLLAVGKALALHLGVI